MAVREILFRKALGEAMSEEMRLNPDVFLIGEEVAEYNGAYKVSQGMLDEFGPERVIDTPITELGFSGMGVGAAMNKLRPIVEFMTFNFSLVAIDQLINNAAKMRYMSGGQTPMSIVFRGPTGNAGQLGAQHSQNFENWYANTPGLKVVVPATPYDAKGLLKSAIRDDNPVVFMESELMYNMKGNVPEAPYTLPIGKAEVIKTGTDVSLLSFGKMVHLAKEVEQSISQEQDISVEIIDLRSLRPIDYLTVVESVKKTNRLVILEEAWPVASISSEIAFHVQRFAFDYLDAPIQRITNKDVPVPYSPTLLEEVLPKKQQVIDAIKATCYLKT